MRPFALLLMIWPCFATAEGWQRMTGDDIRSVLTDQRLTYDTAWQEFRASGRTLYNAGRDSWGYWQVRNDQYCSQWPPGGQWDCYDMQRNGNTLRFVSAFGDVTDGMIAQ